MRDQKKSKDKIRIALLEDEDILGKLYKKYLVEAGFEVLLCEETDKLLAEYEAFDPQIAYLDHALHGEKKSGMDIIPTLKKTHPDIKIVMLSNYSEFQVKQEALDGGAMDYLLKIDTPPPVLASYTKSLLK